MQDKEGSIARRKRGEDVLTGEDLKGQLMFLFSSSVYVYRIVSVSDKLFLL